MPTAIEAPPPTRSATPLPATELPMKPPTMIPRRRPRMPTPSFAAFARPWKLAGSTRPRIAAWFASQTVSNPSLSSWWPMSMANPRAVAPGASGTRTSPNPTITRLTDIARPTPRSLEMRSVSTPPRNAAIPPVAITKPIASGPSPIPFVTKSKYEERKSPK